jgi:micrococcal nuclease
MTRRFAILALLVVAIAARGDASTTPEPLATVSTDGPTSAASEGGRPSSAPAPLVTTPAPTPPAATTSTAPGVAARVTRVVDGDTLKASVAGRTETVRVIGLDTPESVKPGTPVECFALRASAEAGRLLPVGAAIRLESDPTQAKRDRYGRLLAHVWLADGTLYAEQMIRGGFGIHYIYGGVPSINARQLAAAQDEARTAQRGLWSPTTCAGNDHTPAPSHASDVRCRGTVSGAPRRAWRTNPSGSSSAGRAAAFQAACRGFDPRLPLHTLVSCSGRHDDCAFVFLIA